MIQNASDLPITSTLGNLPQMGQTILSWFQTIQFIQITKAVVDHVLYETETPTNFSGVVEVFTAQQLALLPEGQRKWKWISVWSTPALALSPDDIFKYLDIKYRVMGKMDWSKYGYIEYHCCEDFTEVSA